MLAHHPARQPHDRRRVGGPSWGSTGATRDTSSPIGAVGDRAQGAGPASGAYRFDTFPGGPASHRTPRGGFRHRRVRVSTKEGDVRIALYLTGPAIRRRRESGLVS